jgi:phosphoglycerate dehydrogenase-like enzyme
VECRSLAIAWLTLLQIERRCAIFRVAVAGDYNLRFAGTPAGRALDWSALTEGEGHEVIITDSSHGAVAASSVSDCDAVIFAASGGFRFDEASIPNDGRLVLLARWGVGYDGIDLEACTANDIAVTTTPDGVRHGVALGVLTFILALSLRIGEKEAAARGGGDGWASAGTYVGRGLRGRTLGLLGLGNIGAEVVGVTSPLGLRYLAHDPFVSDESARELGVELTSLEDLAERSDFLTINVPLSQTTRGLVDAGLLARMRPTAYLINTARGAVVDHDALVRALAQSRIAGAALDVFETEPIAPDDPLLSLDNVILTPHTIAVTDQYLEAITESACRSVAMVGRGQAPTYVVNREVLGRPGFLARLSALASDRKN